MGKACLREASLAHIARKTTEAKTKGTRDWIRRHVKAERRHRPPKGGKIRKDLQKENKGVASRCFQLLRGHAAIGPYLAEMTKIIRSDGCWLCNSGERQSRHCLFVKCWAWEAQIKELWRRVGKACEWNTRERQLSGYSSRTKGGLRRSCNSCGTLRSEGWLLWHPEGTMRSGRKSSYDPRRRAREYYLW